MKCLGSEVIEEDAAGLAAMERHPDNKIAASCGEGLLYEQNREMGVNGIL